MLVVHFIQVLCMSVTRFMRIWHDLSCCLQGLLSRADWQSSRHVPLLHVPVGSGNGMAASSGVMSPLGAVRALCSGRTAPLDVASVLQPPDSRRYLTLSVTYGILSNLDIGTEHLR